MVGGANTEEGQQHKQGQTMLNEELQEGIRTGLDQSTDCGNDIHPALLIFTPQPQGPGLPAYLTPVAHAPGSAGPQMTMAGRLGTASEGAVLVIARAAAH